MLMLAGGGEVCLDIEALGAQFGAVPSDSTLYRAFHQLDAATRDGSWPAMASVRGEVWERPAATASIAPVVAVAQRFLPYRGIDQAMRLQCLPRRLLTSIGH